MFRNQSLIDRAGTKAQWQDKDNYNEYHLPNTYGVDDIEYQYNKWGFRCDDFDLDSELPILFTGCSFTEGTGLPVEHVWSYQLVEKIRHATGKRIPYWILAQNAGSIDAISNNLYWFRSTFKHKIKYIFGLWPSFSRREFVFDSDSVQSWMNPNQHYTSASKIVDPLFVDYEYSKYQSFRSLMLIDSVRENYNAQLFFSMWSIDANPNCEQEIVKSIFKNFNSVEYPNPELYNINLARDNSHPGPNQHKIIAEYFWNQLREEIT